MLPNEFKTRMQAQLGAQYKAFEKAHHSSKLTSIRSNPKKNNKIAYSHTVPWCSTGYFLNERPNFAHDPAWHAGAYYVQEASSMVLEQVIMKFDLHQSPIKVLDLCAAPGGKSTHLASLLHPESFVLCNEIIPKRFKVLRENLIKWGSPNVYATNSKINQLSHLQGYFDVLLIDAPCSGEGLFRRNHEAVRSWSIPHAQSCAIRQKKIVEQALDLLSPGGYLIYSTCTYNPGENIELLEYISSHEEFTGADISDLESFGFVPVEKNEIMGIQAYPHLIEGEGFFVGVLRKAEHTQRPAWPIYKKEVASDYWIAKVFDVGRGMVDIMHNNRVYGIPQAHIALFGFISSGKAKIDPILSLGRIIGKELIPDHALALSQIPKNYPSVELNMEQSLSYLRKQSLELPLTNKGWYLVQFEQNALGWIKVLPNRINNYYPSEYRLMK